MSDVQSHLDRLERRLEDAEKSIQELKQINWEKSEKERKQLAEQQRFKYPTSFKKHYSPSDL